MTDKMRMLCGSWLRATWEDAHLIDQVSALLRGMTAEVDVLSTVYSNITGTTVVNTDTFASYKSIAMPFEPSKPGETDRFPTARAWSAIAREDNYFVEVEKCSPGKANTEITHGHEIT